MKESDNKLNRLRFNRMTKKYGLGLNEIAEITGNSYGSVRTVLSSNTQDIPRWILLAIHNFEMTENIPNYKIGFSSVDDLIEQIINDDEYESNQDRIDALVSHLNFGFVDYPLSEEKQKYVDVLQSKLKAL